MSIAFYAPMKPPGHPTPSGDRRMSRLLMRALDRAGYPVFLISDWRTYDGKGVEATQQAILGEAPLETERIKSLFASKPPKLWFTYHCYYKAPDLIGPSVARHFGIPYVIAEASRAKKRLNGPWQAFAQAAEQAIDAADILFAMTKHDRFALDRDRTAGQRIITLPPFLNTREYQFAPREKHRGQLRLLTVAMMRDGAKLVSYRRLAAALKHMTLPYTLTIAGDGPARADVETLFPDADFTGALDDDALKDRYADADVFVWPGVDEAYGMVYLEAQASGLPVVAEDHPGPSSVVAASLVPAGDAAEFARKIEGSHENPAGYVYDHHSIERAAGILRETIGTLP